MDIKNIKIKKIKLDKATITDVVRSTLIAVLFSLAAVLILALVAKFAEIPANIIMPINQVIKVVSVLIGCILGIKVKEKGAIKGAVIGLLYTALSIFVFWIISGSLKGNVGFVDFIAGIIAGAVSGVIAVNVRKK